MRPEEQLLEAIFGGLTEEESRYLAWVFPRVCSGAISTERGRELFKKRYPNSKWLPENKVV